MSKPTAPSPKIPGREEVERWLLDYQKATRNGDVESGKKLFHRKVIAFELRCPRASDLQTLAAIWKEQWENKDKFEFLMRDTSVVRGHGMFVVVAEWVVPASIIGGNPLFGRTTFALLDFDGKLLCTHVHNSISP